MSWWEPYEADELDNGRELMDVFNDIEFHVDRPIADDGWALSGLGVHVYRSGDFYAHVHAPRNGDPARAQAWGPGNRRSAEYHAHSTEEAKRVAHMLIGALRTACIEAGKVKA